MAYPQNDEATFNQRVYLDARYYFGGGGSEYAATSSHFSRTAAQLQLPRLYTPETGVRGGILMHNTGTGKTGTVLLCAMQYATGFQDTRPSLFLVPNDTVRNEVFYEVLGRQWVETSSGKPRSFFKRTFMGDAFVDADKRKLLNEMETETQKDKVCRSLWEEHICHFFELETHCKLENLILGHAGKGNAAKLTPDEIRKRYSNRVIIVDEAHYNRKERRLFQALMEVLEHAENVCVFLLTATPMIESAEEICPLINLLLKAENVPETLYLTPEMIRAYVNGVATAKTEEHLRWCFHGRVSYVRGLDPRTFPERHDWGEAIFDDLPQHHVWSCYMTDQQLAVYLQMFMEEFQPNSEAGQKNNLWNKCREVMRGLTLRDMGVWKKDGGGNGSRSWHAQSSPNWKLSKMVHLSVKNVEMHRIVCQEYGSGDLGPALVYSDHVETGVKRTEAFFLANGFSKWKEEEEEEDKKMNVESIPPKRGRSRSKKRQSVKPVKPVKPQSTEKPKLVNISGSATTAVRREAIKVLKSDSNYHGQHIRLVLSSPMGRTGVTMRHFCVGIIDQVGWTRGDMEQLFGRLMRHNSHVHSSDVDCNKRVNLYVLCARIRQEDIDALFGGQNDIIARRWQQWKTEMHDELERRGFIAEDGSILTVDERTLRIAMQRDQDIAKVLRMMKQNAVPLNLSQNYFPDEDTSKHRGSRLYDYEMEPPSVPVGGNLHPRDVPMQPSALDTSFCTLDGWFRFVCNPAQFDYRGDMIAALHECFVARECWPIGELLEMVAQRAHVSTLEAALALEKNMELLHLKLHIRKGWVFRDKEMVAKLQSPHNTMAGSLQQRVTVENEVYQYQKAMSQTEGPFVPVQAAKKLDELICDVIDADQLLGTFQSRTPKISLPNRCASRCVVQSPNTKDIVFTMPTTAPVCGVFNNTCDYPDTYRLKILSFKNDGQFSSVAAGNKYESVDALIDFVAELDGDVSAVVSSSRKSETACDELNRRFLATGRMLPWEPQTKPTLLRLLCVARAWRIHSAISALKDIADELYAGGHLERLCCVLFRLKRAWFSDSGNKIVFRDFVEGNADTIEGVESILKSTPSLLADLRLQLDERVGNTATPTRKVSDYVIRVLDRFQQDRQPHKISVVQYRAALEWIDIYVTKAFASKLDKIYTDVSVEFAKRCIDHFVEEEEEEDVGQKTRQKKQ